jgi:hypothetical protein
MATNQETSRITPRQREGRAVNAVADLLRRTLSVPNIYIEPPSAVIVADVLAVDRAGAGDLHAVEVKLEHGLDPSAGTRKKPSNQRELNELYKSWFAKYSRKLQGIHRQVMAIPAHFRYLAIPEESFDLAFGELAHFGLFPEDGIGRLGIITIMGKGEEAPTAALRISPERFRVDPDRLKVIESRLLSKSRPDIEVRI